MGAPSSWGNVVSDYGRIGISVNVSYPTYTTASVSIEVWFYSKWTVKDTSNNFYFDDGVTSASTNRGKRSISTPSNSSWSESNKVLIYTYPTFSVTRTTSKQTRYCAASLSGIEAASGTMTHYVSYEIEPLPSYSITYNSNGAPLSGSMPANQTKWHDSPIHLQSAPLLADGYACNCWLPGGQNYPQYGFGQAYYDNAGLNLYLSWKEITYAVTYDANGGTPGSTTQDLKRHTQNLQIPASAEPTRSEYNFLGWSTVPNATDATWKTGDYYITNSAVTLYAVWELAHILPSVTDVVVERSNENGIAADDGEYFNVSFGWEIKDPKYEPESISIAVDSVVILTESITESKGEFVKEHLGGYEITSTESSHVITITVRDTCDDKGISIERTIMPVDYPIDVLGKGKGISFGKSAKTAGIVDSNWPIYEKGKPVVVSQCCHGRFLNSPGWYRIATIGPDVNVYSALLCISVGYNYDQPMNCVLAVNKTYEMAKLDVISSSIYRDITPSVSEARCILDGNTLYVEIRYESSSYNNISYTLIPLATASDSEYTKEHCSIYEPILSTATNSIVSVGLPGGIPIYYYGDCNALTSVGQYYIANGGSNKPGDGLNGYLESMQVSEHYALQRYTTYTGVVYQRTKQEKIWGPWRLLHS